MPLIISLMVEFFVAYIVKINNMSTDYTDYYHILYFNKK